MSFYTVPGMPPPPLPASTANSYRQPTGTLPQALPPSPQPPPRASDQEPHCDLLTAWAAHHADTWVRADALHPAVRKLIDQRERLPAVRQKLRQLVDTHRELEAKVVGNAARPVTFYRVIEIKTG